ncbi:MAG TPA: aminotransferase class III-fold pyridoxal phosphate-dependent enzyme, partial [Candidatus Eisenbacteria bacterium]|nr:aminotransferase class III-fold pyridoxal phosphate-dependent enzyme [Candidatus Eisenbacteria bacterium]
LLLGHAHSAVVRAVEEQMKKGALYGAGTRVECELAEAARMFYPAAERLRFVSTGTEATMSALRVARAATKRPVVVKRFALGRGGSRRPHAGLLHADAFPRTGAISRAK